jgi:acyl-CoA synthetase (AMP-forming)/AMP-acid ligase II/pyrroloquinoline quinone (PQQ) biosynthesis protein C
MSLLHTIAGIAASDPDRVALDALDGNSVTFASLVTLITARSHELGAVTAPGAPVVMQRDHGIPTAIDELAMLEAGIPVLSLPAFFTKDQARHAISLCGAQPDPATRPAGRATSRKSAPSLHPCGTARITFTSGSTGSPKGICLSAGHMLQVAASIVDAVGAQHAGRHLALLPPGILLETVAGFFPTLLAGGCYVCPPQAAIGMADPFRPDFARAAQVIATAGITSLILVPEYLDGLVRVMEAGGLRLPALTLVAVGGARVAPDLMARARALGLPVRQGYGLTECASVVSLQRADDTDDGSVGLPLAHMQAQIAEDGEIILHGPVCLGAIGGDAPAAPFPTGDIGSIDTGGRLHIEGRKSNVIITSFGRNISPEWLESALTAQPDIAQAMVFGDGLRQPAALLVPAHPDADLDDAVAAANSGLPAYAQIDSWREVAHFLPGNGHLTGNGRLRRKAIAQTHLDGAPDFYTQLEAQTVRQRLRFLGIPQLQAGLTGTISRDAYVAYLEQAYHHVRHTVPLMQAARARLIGRPDIVAALDEYIAEETGHEEWILSDIAFAGGNADRVRKGQPAPATTAMVAHAYERIANGNAMAFFGMVFVLESVSVAFATRGASAVARNLGLPPQAFSYLTSHGSLDQEHMVYFANLVNALESPDDRDAIVTMAQDMFGLFGGVFASINLEAAYDFA